MSIEQLMQPRYKVIADYPCRPHPIGSIIEFTNDPYDTRTLFTLPGAEHRYPESKFKEYPNLFKPLQWWEERRISDLPNYIRITGDVYKVDEWLNNVGNHPRSVENPNLAIEWHFIAGHSIPTTLEEYLTYINSKK